MESKAENRQCSLLKLATELGKPTLELFSSVDRLIDKAMARLAKWLRPRDSDSQFTVNHWLEPTPAGFALAAGAWLWDSLHGKPSAPTLGHLASLVASSEQGVALAIGMMAAALSAVLVGSEFARPLRAIVAAPLVKLVHHLSMVSFGVFLVIASRELFVNQIGRSQDLAALVYLVILIPVIGLVAMGLGVYVKSDFLFNIERFRTYRWVSIAAGIWLFYAAQGDLTRAVGRLEREHQEQDACKKTSEAATSNGASGAPSAPAPASATIQRAASQPDSHSASSTAEAASRSYATPSSVHSGSSKDGRTEMKHD